MGCLFLVLVFVLQYPIIVLSSVLCSQDQSLALQQLKLKLTIHESSSSDCESNGHHLPYPKTISWNQSTNCCTWDGVTCDRITGQITGLDLSCSQLHGTIDSNSTLFQLSHLRKLNLAYNNFSPSQISRKFGWFPSLTHLNLSHSSFSGRIPSEVSYLSKLISLDLSAALPSNFSSSLEILNLLSTRLSVKFPDDIFHLSKLQKLNLGSNSELRGHFPKTRWNSSSSLRELDLSLSRFSGNIPDIIGHLKSLRFLDLSSCYVSGTIPQSIGNLRQLESLDLSNCSITGPIPPITTEFRKLILLFLTVNSLSGEIPSWIFDLPSLKFLDMRSNQLTGQLKEFRYNLLEVLDLDENMLHGPIPRSFSKLVNLTTLDLSTNNFSSGLDIGIFSNCKQLRRLGLSFNNLALEVLDLRDNLLNDTFPKWLEKLPRLQFLSLRSNRLQNPITTSRNQLLFSKLKIVDVSYNHFTGNFPERFFRNLKSMMISYGSGTRIVYIGEDLYHDSPTVSIKGQQLQLVRILSIFTTINFSHNKFEGDSFENLSILESLDLSSNQLSRNIPQELVALKSLAVMNLSLNNLGGRIPRCPQIDTFENDSYSGNAGLCGFPLSRNCGDNEMHQQPPPFEADEKEDDPGLMDWRVVAIGYSCGMVFGLFMAYVIFLTGRPK
ncbi:receptor-like protein 9DC3 [Nicotiana tomentosiformis]|uniref:receptor-like protein 9DC3 n=1 Tax=Nicotiana tomentosiformis TaxID=4098 RepID=UPI00388C60AC